MESPRTTDVREPNDPIVAPEQTISTMTTTICAPPLREKWPLWWKLSLAAALLFVVILVIAIGWLFYAGVGVWGIDWPVVWGFAIINYVWWIAIASGGTFISALFYLAEVEWRNALNRIAETITIFAAACAAIYPILHLGRPWLFYWLFPYPNVMDRLAAVPKPSALGLCGDPHLRRLLDSLLVFRPRSRPCDDARQGRRAA